MKRILIADDNADFVDMQAAMLGADYHVERAYSARQALELLDEWKDVAAIVSDIQMPEYDGFDLLRVMRHRWPAIPVILVTGFPLDDADASLPPGTMVLQKPFGTSELKRAIEESIAQREERGSESGQGES